MLIGPALDRYGAAWGGAACALVQILTEAAVAFTMLAMMGRRALDERTGKMLLKTAAVCAGVIALDLALRRSLPQLPGAVRMVVNGSSYLLGVVLGGAVKPRELLEFVAHAFRRNGAPPAALTSSFGDRP